MATQYVQYPQPTLNSGPVQFTRNSLPQTVVEDTATPANSRPLPVKILDAGGLIPDWATETTLAGLSAKIPAALGQTTMAGSLSVVIASNQSAVPVSGPLTDAQLRAAAVPVSMASSPLPSGAATETTLDLIADTTNANSSTLTAGRLIVPGFPDGLNTVRPVQLDGDFRVKVGATLVDSAGINKAAISAAGAVRVDGSAVTQPVSGTVGVSGSVAVTGPLTDSQLRATAVPVSAAALPLPAGAATETTLAGLNAKFGTLGQKAMAGSAPVVIASDQSAIPATQSGVWATRLEDASGNGITSSPSGANRALHVKNLGFTVVQTARRDYSTGNVTTGAWVELVASLASQSQYLEVFDSSGQTLELGTGGAGSEARLLFVLPGGNGLVPIRFAASSRISIRAVSGTANTGEITLNFYGT